MLTILNCYSVFGTQRPFPKYYAILFLRTVPNYLDSFKSGILVVGKGEKNTIKLDGWEVTVSAFMNNMIASPEHQNLTDKQIKAAIKAKAELEKSYDFYSPATIDEQNKARDPNVKENIVARKMKPGEYSIHRLFAAISGKLLLLIITYIQLFGFMLANVIMGVRGLLERAPSGGIFSARAQWNQNDSGKMDQRA